MTEPIELCERGSDEIVAYACGKCGSVVGSTSMHGDVAREMASRHCGPWLCRVCGVEHDWSHQTICHDCWRKSRAEREAERDEARFAKATHVAAAEYDGPVADGDEGFWQTIGDAVDELEDDGGEVPAYFWACTEDALKLDANGIIESALEDHHEDAGENISGKDECRLQALLDEWCDTVNVTTWNVDYSRAVVVER